MLMPTPAETPYTFSHFVAAQPNPSQLFFDPRCELEGANPPCGHADEGASRMATSVKATAEASRGERGVQRAREGLGGDAHRHWYLLY